MTPFDQSDVAAGVAGGRPGAEPTGFVPELDAEPSWAVVVERSARSADPKLLAVEESVLTIGDGHFGTRGVLEESPGEGSVLANGVYDESIEELPVLLGGPGWAGLELAPTSSDDPSDRRVLDLRTGTLHRWRAAGQLQTVRFSSFARPGTMALRAEAEAEHLSAGPALSGASGSTETPAGLSWAATSHAPHGGIVAAATQVERQVSGRHTVERLAAYVADSLVMPHAATAVEHLHTAQRLGFDALLSEHRAAWARMWQDCQIDVPGDPETELGARYAMFQLLSAVPAEGEAALGARGLSGPGYAGHVFWDADVFVLPALAAIRPEAARAMLEYRLNRLGAARRNAAEYGRSGARFPWESARDGTECTPGSVVDTKGNVIPVETGELEEHIVADVAWAAWQYICWTGDTHFRDGPGRPLITEGARYWASRVERDEAGRGHIRNVIGPDEYHENVDDNAYTNVMARWNLRLAATLVESDGIDGTEREAARWRRIAASLVDNYDAQTGRYEQYCGFNALRPFVVSDVLELPAAADTELGRDVTLTSQIVKQADVLMLHLMVPEEVAAGSLSPNLDFYAPLTSHGSSLSPAVHAGLFARAGRPEEGLGLLRLATHLDLHNLNDTTAKGLHIATMGGLWQALALGFGGLRAAHGRVLSVDPQLPSGWGELGIRVRVGSTRVGLTLRTTRIEVSTDGPLTLRLPDGGEHALSSGEMGFTRSTAGVWSVA